MLGAFGGIMLVGYGLMWAITPTDDQLMAVSLLLLLLSPLSLPFSL
jgi:hypothetical protein